MKTEVHKAMRATLEAGGRVAFPPALGEPDLIARLTEILPNRADVEVMHSYRIRPEDLEVPPSVRVRSLFGGRGDHSMYTRLRAGRFHSVIGPNGPLPVDIALVRLSPPGPDGLHSVGPSATWTRPLIESARLVIAEIDPELPRTSGPGAAVPAEWVHVTVEAEHPLHHPPTPKPVRAAEAAGIARHLAALVADDATVQVGMGRHAQAALSALRGHADLGFVCGLLSGPMLSFIETLGGRSELRKISVGEAIGGADLMSWISHDPRLQFETGATIHNPTHLSRNPRLVTINSVLEVDVLGQVNCEAIGDRVVGGLGGLPDYQEAANLSPGGRNIVIVPSDARGRARIVERLSSPYVSVGRTNIDYVVSEHGVADIRGTSIDETRDRLRAICGGLVPS